MARELIAIEDKFEDTLKPAPPMGADDRAGEPVEGRHLKVFETKEELAVSRAVEPDLAEGSVDRCSNDVFSPKSRPKKSFAKKVPSAADDRRYKSQSRAFCIRSYAASSHRRSRDAEGRWSSL
jgi:hypothetical protein